VHDLYGSPARRGLQLVFASIAIPVFACAQAPLRLPKIFGDAMVVQRSVPIPVWGWAQAGATVSVKFGSRSASAKTGDDGRWKVTLPSMQAGGPYELAVESGAARIVVHDVLVGDIWVASGQSNMELLVSNANDAEREIANAHDPQLRMFTVPNSYGDTPAEDVVGGSWASADPQHTGKFTAVGYYFARELRRSVGVPIGIIHTSWGGANIETWMSRKALALTDSSWNAIQAKERARTENILSALRQKIGSLPTEDRGTVNGRPAWADPMLDDATWSDIKVPSYWELVGWDGLDGVAWYRTSFTLSADDAARGARLNLGPVDDNDATYVNGVEVGRTNGYAALRSYNVPASALRVGRNVIAIRVEDTGGNGGLNGRSDEVYLEIGGQRRSLGGTWKFAVGSVSLKEDGQRINKIPTFLYNLMLHPLLQFPIKGAIWYQGESNANNDAQAVAYRDLFSTMIKTWRSEWTGTGTDFPFLWVQLPNYGKVDSLPPKSSGWALLRESQSAALALPHTGQAIAIDLGAPGELHPKNKQDVGLRLAFVAREQVYGQPVVSSGPVLRRQSVRNGKIELEFDAKGGAIVSHVFGGPDLGARVTGFAIAGADGKFVWADARIDGTKVVVWSDAIANPVAVRYAWANAPVGPSLYGSSGLPAAPFRTDTEKFPIVPPGELDHQDMMRQLGIRALRPGPSGNDTAWNHANYDEKVANPYPNLPDLLTLKNGTKVTTAAAWWSKRRVEIEDDLAREVYGRLPSNIPNVSWRVVASETDTIGGVAAVAKQLVGHVDNSSFPAISVDIAMTVVVPEHPRRSVPVLMMFGRSALPSAPAPRFGPPLAAGGDPPTPQQLLADGWGYALIDPSSIQADNGGGLTAGIIGLVNKGRHRTPDQWGSLRAWAWGAARGLDYLETDPAVDAKHVGIEGVSRYGKAALVTLAFEQRFAIGLIGSSGKGGATLNRRNWGEAVESLTGGGEYHWMAGNYLKYGASDATFGSGNASMLPVDSHSLIAMCAPRLTFISYGVPEKGDAKWLDHQGSYMATVAAGSVFKLLGARDIGVSNDYHTEKMPAVNVGLLDGELAWRQHDGGHTDAPNVKYFIQWADKMMKR
jgi:sialate O-acetylesterase